MARRKTVNRNGISRIQIEGSFKDAYVSYVCVQCGKPNFVNIGRELISPEDLDDCIWVCDHCGFIHSIDSPLPSAWEHWQPEYLEDDTPTAIAFWTAFLRQSTLHPEYYWKKCNVCGRILPWADFAKHTGWGPLEKQMECRSCKAAINTIGNPRRTTEQHRESSIRRRIADMFVAEENERIDIAELFERFGGKCFKTGVPLDINATDTWHIDHIMPSKYLWPLTVRNAALLSSEANENKKAMWPSQFYTPQQLVELSRITGADLEMLSSPTPIINHNIDVNKGVNRYLKVRNSNDALPKRVAEIRKVLEAYDLVDRLDEQHKKMLGY